MTTLVTGSDSAKSAAGQAAASSGGEVVVVSQMFYPELISTGQTLTELLEALAARGLKLTVIAAQPTLVAGSKPVAWDMEHAGIRIRRVWSTRLPKTRTIGKVANLASFFLAASWRVLWRHRRAHLVLQSNPPFLPLLGWLCHVVRRQSFGVFLADIMPEQAERLNFIKPNGLVARVWRRANHAWNERAAYIVVFGDDMREGAMSNANQIGAPGEAAARARTHVIPLWADLGTVQPMDRDQSGEAARLGIGNRLVVQYSGNHARFHDLETLLAIARAFSEDDEVLFQFIGEGQKKRLVQEAAGAPGGRLIYTSTYVPREKLRESLAMADLGVVAQLPGQERVCYPSKMLGIIAAGRAVLAICPPDCELGRFVRQQDLGWVVANGDAEAGRRAVLEAKGDRQRVRRCGENGARWARDLRLETIAPQYEQLMRACLEAAATRR